MPLTAKIAFMYAVVSSFILGACEAVVYAQSAVAFTWPVLATSIALGIGVLYMCLCCMVGIFFFIEVICFRSFDKSNK